MRYFFILCFLSYVVMAADQVVEKIQIMGLGRIEHVTVSSYLNIHIGQKINNADVDAAMKRLFESKLFDDVDIRFEKGVLHVQVRENPILNQIVFEGNDAITDEDLTQQTGLRPREVYTPTRVHMSVGRLRDLYYFKGRLNVKIRPVLIQRPQNRVDLIFQIDEGSPARIQRIFFTGNTVSDQILSEQLRTRESRWYRFFSSDDLYNPDQVEYDKEQLRKFYLNNGYYKINILSSIAEINPRNSHFYITFILEEGKIYTFHDVQLISQIDGVDVNTLQECVKIRSGQKFSQAHVTKTVDALMEKCLDNGISSIDIEPIIEENAEKQQISVKFVIQPVAPRYVRYITPENNRVTDDQVIRREMRVYEGDVINRSKINQSQEYIDALDYFSSARIEEVAVPGDANLVDLKVKVSEKSTGQIKLGAGYSTIDGPLGRIGYSDRNFLGRGQDARIAFLLGKRNKEVSLGLTEPYFLGRRLIAGFDVTSSSEREDTRGNFKGGYRNQSHGLDLHLGYHITDHLIHMWSYSIATDKTRMSSGISRHLKDSEGRFCTSTIGHHLTYDRRNSSLVPTKGYMLQARQDFTGIGGNIRYLSHSFLAEQFFSLESSNQWVIRLNARYNFLSAVGKKLRLMDRFQLGGLDFYGFDSSGIGPRDDKTRDALGGRQSYKASARLTFPIGLPKEMDVNGMMIFEMGSVWNSGKKAHDIVSNKFYNRMSMGTGILWRSRLGVIGVVVSRPLKRFKIGKRKIDETRSFQIIFGSDY